MPNSMPDQTVNDTNATKTDIWAELEEVQSSEEDIIANKKAGRVYVADFARGQGRYVSMVFDENEEPYDIGVKISPRVEVRLTYITTDGRISGMQISKLTNGELKKLNLSTMGFRGVLGLLHIFSGLDFKSVANRSIVLDAGVVGNELELRAHLNTILADEHGAKVVAELASAKGLVSGKDIGNITKKRQSLQMMKKLLSNDEYFQAMKKEQEKTRDEDLWQWFFEDNKWIFGYGLEYVFNAPISADKFEQTIQGSDFQTTGRRPDGVLKTLGMSQFLNIVEIKTHKTALMGESSYRDGVWKTSNELAGAIAQAQQYIRASKRNWNEVIELNDGEGNRTQEEVFNISPKCFLVIGSMQNDFLDENGRVLNPNKLSCFEMFRKNVLTPEIITFDQLYLRAKNIIEHNE